MMSVANNSYCSIWLKPMLKCLDKIIDCKNAKKINYNQIKTGNIISLEFKDSNNDIHERTYIATTNWDKKILSGSFINLNGSHIILSAAVLKTLNISVIGSLKP